MGNGRFMLVENFQGKNWDKRLGFVSIEVFSYVFSEWVFILFS